MAPRVIEREACTPRNDAAATNITAVDCHAHVMRRDAPLAPDRHSAPKRDCTVEEYLSVLDAHGISHGVLTAPSFYGADNSLLLDALDRAGGRLRGTIIVDPRIDRASLAAMSARGAAGIRLNWIRRSSLPDVSTADYRHLFANVRDLDWHVEIYLEGPFLAKVLPAIRESGAKVVVDHFGSPDPAQGVACGGFKAVLDGVRAGEQFLGRGLPVSLFGDATRKGHRERERARACLCGAVSFHERAVPFHVNMPRKRCHPLAPLG